METVQGGGGNGMEKEAAAAYGTGKVELVHDDFLHFADSMEDNSIDLVFTDPPYELVSGGMKRGRLLYRGGEIFKNGGFQTKQIEFAAWIPEIYRILREERYFYVMSNDRNLFRINEVCLDSGFQFCELLVLDKKMAVPSSYYPKRAEFILMYRKGGYRKAHFTGSTVIEARMPRGKGKRHPTEKPVPMIKHLVECSTLEDEVCFDPFMGSGTTGEACIRAGRRFVGVEIEKKWFRASQERMMEAGYG